MNVGCPDCGTVYRIDPARVPAAGARTRCRECGTAFAVERRDGSDPGEVVAGGRVADAVVAADSPAADVPDATSAPAAPSASPAAPSAPPGAPVFGPQDPDVRARRLARALVSDIKVYNRDRWERSRAGGTLRKDFRDEIVQSWEEYVEQVGETMAKRTPHFREALNEILADGERVF